MTDENAKKKYAHLKNIIEVGPKTGNSVRDELMKSDAKKHMADLVKKRPHIVFEEPIKVEPTKSKGKK